MVVCELLFEFPVTSNLPRFFWSFATRSTLIETFASPPPVMPAASELPSSTSVTLTFTVMRAASVATTSKPFFFSRSTSAFVRFCWCFAESFTLSGTSTATAVCPYGPRSATGVFSVTSPFFTHPAASVRTSAAIANPFFM